MESELGPLRCCIIGAGVVGRLLGAALQRGGLELTAASSRDPEHQRLAAHQLGIPVFDDVAAALAGADLVVLTVPHESVPASVRLIAQSADQSGTALRVITTCGLSPLATYGPLLDARVNVAIVHPLRVFTAHSTLADLAGCPAAVTAPDDATLTFAQAFAHTAGLIPFELQDDRRALYHAAAQLVGNGTAVLQAAAQELARLAGIPEGTARNIGADHARRTVDTVETDGPAATLEGPVVRGDTAAIEAHLSAINAVSPQLAALYARVTEATVRLAIEHHRISMDTASSLDAVLVSGRTPDRGT